MNQNNQANLPQERLEKQISSKKLFHYNRKSAIHLEPESIFLKTIKRSNASLLKFESSDNQELPKGFSQRLAQVIGSDKSIRELILSIPSDFTDEDLLSLTHGLKKLKSLERLTLDMSNSSDLITNKGLYYLMKGLKRLSLLKSFSFNIGENDKISDMGLNYVSRSIKKMGSLKKIHLDFTTLLQDINEGMFKVSESLNHLERLEDMTLIIDGCSGITDRSFKDMRLNRLISLRKISLEFFHCGKITDETAYSIAQGLKKLPNLQTFQLKFSECRNLGRIYLPHLWEMLNSLPSLKKVSLEFPKWDEVCFWIMNNTLTCLGMLEKLSIRFNSCSKITDEGLVDLCKTLEEAISLQELIIYLAGSELITDTGVKSVIDSVKKLTHLKRVGLGFKKMKKVTDASVKEMNQFFLSQTSLTEGWME